MVKLHWAAQGHSNFGLSYLAEIFERFSPHHVEAQNKKAGKILLFCFVFRYHDVGFCVFFGLREILADSSRHILLLQSHVSGRAEALHGIVRPHALLQMKLARSSDIHISHIIR